MNNWIKATELPSELPHTILTLMENGRMFAYNTSNNLKGLHEVIKHHPEILCLCVNLPSPDTPGEEGRAYLEIAQQLAYSKDKPFFVDTVKKVLNLYDREEISFSKFVEILNVTAFKWAAARTALAGEGEDRKAICSHCGDEIEHPLCSNCDINLTLPTEEY